MKNLIRIMIWLALFSMGMAFLESMVVVYLRRLFYPEGFHFPLVLLDDHTYYLEIFRETATLLMLVSVAYVAGRQWLQAFAWFLYSFAIWDMFYYVFLKLILGWPESFLTWDILFLIPVVWDGPVLAPLLSSLQMLVLALLILWNTNLQSRRVRPGEWITLICGAILQLTAYTWNYTRLLMDNYSLIDNKMQFETIVSNYIPKSFNWGIFITGYLMVALMLVSYYLRKNIRMIKPE